MKYSLIVFVILSFIISLSCDGDKASVGSGFTVEVAWEKEIGGEFDDAASCIIRTYDGNYLIAGNTGSFGTDGSEVLLLKISDTGDTLWASAPSGAHAEVADALFEPTPGTFVAAGTAYMGEVGDFNGFLGKYDANGNVQSVEMVGDGFMQSIEDAIIADDGGIMTIGMISGPDHLSSDVWLVKFDGNYDYDWQSYYDGYFNYNGDIGRTILRIGSNDYLIIGESDRGFDTDELMYLVRVDSEGVKQGELFVDLTYDYVIKDAVMADDGDFVVSGWGYDPIKGVGIFAAKVGLDGTVRWESFYGGSHSGGGEAVAKTSDGGYVMTGFLVEEGIAHCYTVKLNSVGSEEWSKMTGLGVASHGYDILQAVNGDFIIVGTTDPGGGVDPYRNVYMLRIAVRNL